MLLRSKCYLDSYSLYETDISYSVAVVVEFFGCISVSLYEISLDKTRSISTKRATKAVSFAVLNEESKFLVSLFSSEKLMNLTSAISFDFSYKQNRWT